jgi:hypothetical protein
MSIFYNAYFIKTQATETQLKERFGRVDFSPESEWVVCDLSDDYTDGIFEAGSYFTKEIAARFGETIFICVDTSNDQFEYEHSKDGTILRKLSWIYGGAQSTWEWVEGERETWEDNVVFSETNFARTLEMGQYESDLDPEELRAIWDERRYVINGKQPWGDATMGMVIEEFFGIKRPDA